MRRFNNHFFTRSIALSGSFLLVSASAAVGTLWGWQQGILHGTAVATLFAGAALGAEALKPFAVAGIIDGLRARDVSRTLACFTFALIAILFNVAAALGFASATRGDQAAQRAAIVERQEAVRSARTRALTELSAIPPAKRPERRNALETAIRTADGQLSQQTVHVASADPLSATLAAYAAAAGHPVSAKDLAPWLALLPVLLLEIGSALSVVIVRSLVPPRASLVQASPADVSRTVPPTDGGSRTPTPTESEAAVLDVLKRTGGQFKGGQRKLGQLAGLPKSSLNDALHTLAANDRVALQTTATGTVVRLVA